MKIFEIVVLDLHEGREVNERGDERKEADSIRRVKAHIEKVTKSYSEY